MTNDHAIKLASNRPNLKIKHLIYDPETNGTVDYLLFILI